MFAATILLFCTINFFLRPIKSSSRHSTPRVVVIGGGPAGYFSAIQCAAILKASNVRSQVMILEAGKSALSKVLISGGGRCNLMHDPSKPLSHILEGYPRGKREITGAFTSKFGPKEVYGWFSKRGLEMKVEPDGRVFPVSNKAASVVDVLRKEARDQGVAVFCDVKVKSVEWASSENNFNVYCEGTGLHEMEKFLGSRVESALSCDRIVLATGSARTGYNIASSLGHKPIVSVPALFSFKIDCPQLTDLAGISVEHVKVKLSLPSNLSLRPFASGLSEAEFKASLSQRGPLLITKEGISGPAVLRLSSFAAKLLASQSYRAELKISWLGDLSRETVLRFLLSQKDTLKSTAIGKVFPGISSQLFTEMTKGESARFSKHSLHMYGKVDSNDDIVDVTGGDGYGYNPLRRRLWGFLLQRVGLDPTWKWSEIPNAKLQELANELVGGKFLITGRGLFRDEFVTCGGVSLKEINLEGMESKLRPGLHVAGELLDVDGVTGGYNFQNAWTTGYVAGSAAVSSLISS